MDSNPRTNGNRHSTPSGGVEFRDHYSTGRSTELRFRGKHDQKVFVLDDVGRDQQLMVSVTNMEHQGLGNGFPSSSRYNQQQQQAKTILRPSLHSRGSFGTALLRAIAALVSGFVLSCWIAFTIQCLLFLFMNVVGTYTPSEWTNNPPIGNLLGCIAACPLLLDMLARMLTMSQACTIDCWRGIASHPSSLWKTNARLGRHSEWPTLVVFFGIPLLACGIATLCARGTAASNGGKGAVEDGEEEPRGWYEWTMLAWAGGVWVFQMVYMELCVYNELVSCHKLLKHCLQSKTLMESIKVSLLLAQRQKYSGVRMERYLVENPGDNNHPSSGTFLRTGFSRDGTYQPVQFKYTLGTRWTKLGIMRWCYDQIEDRRNDYRLLDSRNQPPRNRARTESSSGSGMYEDNADPDPPKSPTAVVKRNYSIDEVFGNITIITKSNWSLERLWCVNQRRVTDLIVVSGKDSVTQCQFISGYLCVAFATVLIILVLTGCLMWLGKPLKSTILIILLVFALCFFPMLVSLHKLRQHQANNNCSFEKNNPMESKQDDDPGRPFDEIPDGIDDDGSESCEVLVSVWESVRVTELKEWACYATASMEIAVLFVWPLVSLFLYENNMHIGIVFLVLGLHGLPRHYFNASYFLQEFGRIDDLDLSEADLSPFWSCSPEEKSTKEHRDLDNKALIANTIRRITCSSAKNAWIYFLFVFFSIFSIAYYKASHEEMFSYAMGQYKWKGVVYADDFYWDPQPQLAYPTCEIQKGFSFPGEQSSTLASYSFLATLAFSSPAESQPLLDQWFGEGRVIDDYELVESFRRFTGTENHPVAYKLYTFADDPTSGIVGIRGSESMWDWMVDMQLWGGSLFAQGIRNLNPLGFLWDPILDEVVYLINSVQSQNLKEVSYYRFTTEFVEALYNGYEGRTFENLRVTGNSLGGGLAILTGAITGASAVAFSGLNAMFSRRTFLPPITREQLNTRVFNTIPERDPIANIDKPGMLYQRMQCIGPENSLFACHSIFRTICEIQYRCGSQGRPINCWCVGNYGYPEPTQNGTVTWEEACSKTSTPPDALATFSGIVFGPKP